MAQEILNNLLHFKILPKEILDWLTTDNINDIQWMEFNKKCSREEFVTFFLNYLRDQFTSVLQSANVSKQTPAKKILAQPRIIRTSKSTKANVESAKNNQNFVTCTGSTVNDLRKQTENSLLSPQQNVVPTECHSTSTNKSNLDSHLCQNVTVTPVKHNLSEGSKAIGVSNKFLNINSVSPITSPQTSTPIIKKKGSPHKKRVELITCSSSQGRHINPAFKESFEYEQVNNMMDSKNISFDNNSFPSLGANNSSSLNISNLSAYINKSESSDLFNSNFSQKSNYSMSNKVLQSPISPLYSNSISMLSPMSMKVPQYRYNDGQSNHSYSQQNITSTPERTSNNVPRNSKTTPRQNFSLGDFIVTESRSSKKGSGRKNNSKILLRNGEQKDNDQQSVLSDTSSTHSEQNTRRRKVNPTRLNVTDEKGNKENTVFGIVSRPFTQNPQFVNVSPIDKSVDNASFQEERGLVKIERQKVPKSVTNTIATTNVTDEQSQPRWKILPRTPNKVANPSSIIIPNKTLVENMEILNILAEMYSGFLDHNLVINPMTELYFIIHLITIQYTTTKPLSSAVKIISEKVKNQNAEVNESSDVKKNLSMLRKSLNFDDVLEESDMNKNVKSSNENNLQYNKHSDELGCFSLEDETKENLNQINTKLKKISVSKLSDDSISIVKKEKNNEELGVSNDCVKMYLETPHNCVYFSTQVLNHQKAFLKCLDRVTLKLLCENNQIATFQPELCKYLDTTYSIKVTESNKNKSFLNIGTVELNVCFQIDTDNREKFPSAIAFQCFKKQRDMFYEILKIWEDNHLVPGWTFQIALTGKIKTMLTMHVDITNYTHLTRLFKSQMLISCIQSGQQEDSLDDETASFLKNLKDNNPEKLTQLQRKLVTPLSHNGPVPLPSFPGIQEFYKDFILYASHPMFYAYLEDTFIHEIMELNNSQFAGSDIEDTETEVDEHTKQNFVVCLSSLRLLSKYLGFMISLPYRSETSMLDDVITSQITLRSKSIPRIDLQYCLQSAVMQGKLSLTVPWVVEYLAMMDHASLRLPYYKRILEMLYCIYRASNYHAVANSEELMSQKTAVLVKLAIGWLFELPVFPTELYYSWQSKYNDKTLKMICETQQPITQNDCSLTDADTSVVSVKHCLFLDKLEMVDDRILYSCCPYLRELNILLTPGNSSVNNSTSYRHVTPVTSQLQKPVKKTNTKHLEIQLEEAFFHGQPMSTRKTVEYVSERVASSCVKYIYNNLLPVERQKNFDALKSIVDENYSEVLERNPELVKNALLKDMNLLSAKASKNVKEKSEEVIPKICESRITQSMESLLAEDCLKPVKNMCVKIAMRMAMERIDQWIQSHIVGGSTFVKDMEVELNRAFKTNDEVVIDKKCHNLNAASPTDVLADMRQLMWDLIETNGQLLTIEILSKFLDQLHESLIVRSDLKLIPEKVIASLSVDLCLFLITYKEDLFNVEIQKKFFEVWKIEHLKFSEPDSPLSRILSPRNIMLMAQSANGNVWLSCGKFLKALLKENILSIDVLSDQTVALFRHEWTVLDMKHLSTCLKEAIEGYKSSDEETERIRYLLGWVAGAYNDMDHDSFNFSFD